MRRGEKKGVGGWEGKSSYMLFSLIACTLCVRQLHGTRQKMFTASHLLSYVVPTKALQDTAGAKKWERRARLVRFVYIVVVIIILYFE